jgi:hypothetical protein
MMLATWLVEIYLSKINQLEDIAAAERSPDDVENLKVEKSLLEDEMRQFLSTYKVRGLAFSTSELLTDPRRFHRRTSTARPSSTCSTDMAGTR